MTNECPLCLILPNEPVLYQDDLVYLVNTKDMKGHQTRVMCCIHEHSSQPSELSQTKAYAVIMQYMFGVMKDKPWYILCDSAKASYHDHWHIVASDALSFDADEMKKLTSSTKVLLPIRMLII